MLSPSKVRAHSLLAHSKEVKPGINTAFTDVQWGLRPTEDIGFYKSRREGLSCRSFSQTDPSLSYSRAALENNEDGLIQTKSEAGVVGLGDYKDLLAKSGTRYKSSCGAWAIVSECSSGEHHFAKKLLCGKEWCAVCGQDDSAAHKRRQARILPKIQQISKLGYLVIEFPDWARHIGERGICPDLDCGEYVAGWCYSKADLRETTNTIINVLAGKRGAGGRGSKRIGGYFKRGLGRWHWFGDKIPGKWNPHFNILVDSGYMSKPLLRKIKADLRAALNCPVIVHYSYSDKPGQMVQKARYITRATFRDYAWNPYMARELFNLRNMRWWGSWKCEPAWELRQAEAEGGDLAGLTAVSKLQEGTCPDCGRPLKVLHHNRKTGKPVLWSRAVDSVYLDIWSAKEIAGSGYYWVPQVENNSYTLSPAELLRLEQIEARARNKPSMHPFAVLIRKSRDDLWHMTRTYKAMERMRRRRAEESKTLWGDT